MTINEHKAQSQTTQLGSLGVTMLSAVRLFLFFYFCL